LKTVLFELLAKFTGDSSGLDKATKQAEMSLGKLAKMAVAVAGPAALGALVVKQLKVIDATLDMANQFAISTTALGAMKLVAREAGVEFGKLAGTMTIMQRNIFTAATGEGDQRTAIKVLGLDVKELAQMKPDEQFGKLSEAIAKVENPTLKAGLAAKVFGKNARELMQVFDDYAEKLENARQFNEKFNVTVSQIDSEKVSEANDAFDRVKDVVQGLGNTIAVEVAPLITSMSNALVNAGIDGEDFAEATKKAMKVAAFAIDVVRHAIRGMSLMYNAAIVGIMDATAKASRQLVKFAEAVADVMNLIPGIERQPNQALKLFADNMTIGAAEGKREIADLVKEMQTFESTSSRIEASQSAAEIRARAAVNLRNNMPGGTGDLSDLFGKESAEDAKKALDELRESWNEQSKQLQDFRSQTASVFSDFTKNVMRGENALESFKNKMLDVAGSVIDSMFQMSFGNSSGGGLFGTIAESIFSGFGISGGQPNAGFKPGISVPPRKPFAKGGAFLNSSTMFPMSTGIGEGGEAGMEAIMPLSRGADGKLGVRGSGGGVTVHQNLNISTGVQQTVRAEIQRMMPDIQAASKAAVQDGLNRGAVKG